MNIFHEKSMPKNCIYYSRTQSDEYDKRSFCDITIYIYISFIFSKLRIFYRQLHSLWRFLGSIWFLNVFFFLWKHARALSNLLYYLTLAYAPSNVHKAIAKTNVKRWDNGFDKILPEQPLFGTSTVATTRYQPSETLSARERLPSIYS